MEMKNEIKTLTYFGHTTISYYEEFKQENYIRNNRFICSDIFDVMDYLKIPCESIIVIESINTEEDYRRKNYARRAMECFARAYDNKIIVTQSAPLISEYPEEPNAEEHRKILIKYAQFLESIGFRNSNILHGFEESIGYVYKTTAAKPLIKHIIGLEI